MLPGAGVSYVRVKVDDTISEPNTSPDDARLVSTKSPVDPSCGNRIRTVGAVSGSPAGASPVKVRSSMASKMLGSIRNDTVRIDGNVVSSVNIVS